MGNVKELEIAKKIADATTVTFKHGHVKASFTCEEDTCGVLKRNCGEIQLKFKVNDAEGKQIAMVTICGLTYNMECKTDSNQGYRCPHEVANNRRRRLLRFRGGGGS